MPDMGDIVALWDKTGSWWDVIFGTILIIVFGMAAFYARRAINIEDSRRKEIGERLSNMEITVAQVERKEQADDREKNIRRDIQTQRTQDTLYLQRVMDELKMNHREVKQEFLVEIREQRTELKKQNDYMHETNRKIDLLIHRDKQSRAGDRIDAERGDRREGGREGSREDRRSGRTGSIEDRIITPDPD